MHFVLYKHTIITRQIILSGYIVISNIQLHFYKNSTIT